MDRKLTDDLDILHLHEENAENIEPHSDVSPEKEDFLDKPSPPKMRKKNVRQSLQKSQLPTHKLFNNQEHMSSHPLIIPISTTRHLQKPISCEQTYLPPLSPSTLDITTSENQKSAEIHCPYEPSPSNSKTEAMTVATFNIEGFTSNKLYLNTLAKRADSILLQEHWLHSYESNKIEDQINAVIFVPFKYKF